MITLAALSIVPLLWISLYNHPSADDFDYAFGTYAAWKSSRNILAVIKEAAATSVRFWHKWQGLYTSAFLLALEPAIFGEQYYRITGFLTVGTVVLSNLIFSVYVLHRRLKCRVLTAAAFAAASACLMLQWMPSAVEGLYWYNGAMNYTFFFGLLLVVVCLILELCRKQKKGRLVMKLILTVVLAVALSGGNHVTAFAGLLLTAGIFACMMILKKKSYAGRVLGVLIFQTAGFLLNVSSPGTRVRASAFAEPKGILWTVWNALVFLMEQMNRWLGLAVIAALVLLLPFLWREAKGIYERTGFKFSYPLAVLLASIALMGAMLCPSYYAMGAAGAGRLVNVIYFAFVLLVFINAFYLCGYLGVSLHFSEFSWKSGWTLTIVLVGVGALIGCTKSSAGYSAWQSASSGEAGLYSQEADARYNLYINSKGEDVEVSPFSVYPQLLYFDDITEDAADWRNQNVTEYYGLKNVKIKE